jgi:hypothetical protein
MRYIKKFNEELDTTSAYRNVANALRTNHPKRAKKLERHANIIIELNTLNKLKKDLKKYLPYGIYDAGSSRGSKLKEQFAICISYDDWAFEESFEEDESNFWIRISTEFLPILEESEEEHIRDYYSQMSGQTDSYVENLGQMEDTTIGIVCNYFGQSNFWGSFNGPSIYVNMGIENNKIDIKSISIDDDSGEYTLDILGRKSGIQFKNLLVKLFSNENFDFPTYDGQNLQQVIKQKICVDTGFSKKYKFSFGEIGEFIKKQGINKFFDSFDFVN